MLKSIMCIGCACEGHMIIKLTPYREKGPVDNVLGINFYTTLGLFDGSFERQVKAHQFTKIPIRFKPNNQDFEFPLPCGYSFVHNDLSDPSFYHSVLSRIECFNSYLKRAETDTSLYFLYTPNDRDSDLFHSDVQTVLSILPPYVSERLFVLQTRPLGDRFSTFLPTLKYPRTPHEFFHKDTNEELLQLFSDFLTQNQEFFGLV